MAHIAVPAAAPGRPPATVSPRLAVLADCRGRVLLLATAVSLAALAVALVGLVVDDRTITGVPAWLKPLKFAISIAVYCATLAWLLTHVTGHRRLVLAVGWTTGLALAAELVLIGLQVVRGTTSHFNLTTTFDSQLFSAMGGLIAAVFSAAVVTAVLVVRQRELAPVLAAGIRGGLLVALLGMAAAGLMLANTTDNPGGGHTVGAPDGGPGLPLTGWSTAHGDLRVAHFVGLHALQLLPLVAWALDRWAGQLQVVSRVRLVHLASVGCAAGVVLLAWQALRGLPLLRPDAAVVTVGAGLAAVLVAGAALVLSRDGRS